MEISLDCVPCIVNNFIKLLDKINVPKEAREPALKRLLLFMANADYRQSPPALGREIHKMIREELNNPDPYFEVKKKYNNMLMDMYADFQNMVMHSKNPFDTALRLAIAGNVIDFGSKYQLDIMETIQKVKTARFAVDDSALLENDLKIAKTLLYIGDNCGEIVLDKLFLETIHIPEKIFVVRGGPVINDITMDDARMTGIDKVAQIITTGDNAPGAVWDTTSAEFKEIFKRADIIISKGQGNLEGLIDVPGNIYFLFVAKCDLIAGRVGAEKGGFVVKRSDNYN